jgi:hypothetical protein
MNFLFGLLNGAGFLFGFLLTLFLLLLTTASIIAFLTALKMRRHWRRYEILQSEWQTERFDTDGRPFPPFARGMCDSCHKAFEKVYHMPTGRRLCPACFSTVANAPGDLTDDACRPD